ncbi:Dihydroorotase [Candidatus Rhodobacter oscarellae]|uniref:Dihydroorotase n=1 Tax=Candidatus Rhodobacter oscarellae TaxID=1675527 RepID=A0A0J9E6W0_9RHOB|nr:dihydroorotase [Candidatus Rhodobacter lobularis]KMW57549.1 Dihydroorotase [Candidatus Rhodobacter lobularis]
MTTRLEIRRPDDWHLHLRDGAMLKTVLPESARHFARAIIMPNLVPPVVTGDDARAYRDRIMAALPDGYTFDPLMTLYLTEHTDPDDVAAAHASGLVKAVKLYPAGATTNSASGVRDFDRVRPVFERMSEIGLPLCVHGEVTDAEIDIFDREAVFIDRVLDPIRRATPGLRVVMEHITTSDAVDYASAQDSTLGATITVQHLMLDRNDMLVGGIRPHYYCLPILKRGSHREALQRAAISGDPRFFLGTDSAPHATHAKENACGCAGCFTAPIALACLAETFEGLGALDRLEGFVSLHGPAFYGLPANTETVTLTKGAPQDLPPPLPVEGGSSVTVFDPGRPLHWSVL